MSNPCEIVEFTGYTCGTGTTGGGGGGACSDWYSSCRNPLYALDHPDECDSGSLAVSELSLTPATMTIPAGRGGYVQAIAHFNDGRSADVTGETAFTSADTGVVIALGKGLLDGVAPGTTTITGIWNGKLAVATVTVEAAACIAAVPWDVVVVADDGSVWVEAPVFTIRNEASVRARALRRFQSNARDVYPAAILQLMLSMDLLDAGTVAAADGYVAGGWNQVSLPEGIGGSREGNDRIWTGSEWSSYVDMRPCFLNAGGDTGKALMDAAQILLGSGRPGARKLVVLYSAGAESSCSPSIRSAANVVVGNAIDLAVVTPLRSTNAEVVSPCDLIPTHVVLSEIPSATCFFFDGGAMSSSGVFGAILATVCGGCSGSSGGGVGIDEI